MSHPDNKPKPKPWLSKTTLLVMDGETVRQSMERYWNSRAGVNPVNKNMFRTTHGTPVNGKGIVK